EAGPRRIPAPVSEATVILGWSLPGGYREDQALTEISVAALQGAVGSLIHDDVDELRCLTSIGVEASLALCSMEVIEGADPAEIAGKAIDGVYLLYNERERDWQSRTFGAARTLYVTDLLRAQSSAGRDEVIGRYLHYTGESDPFTSWLAASRAVDD